MPVSTIPIATTRSNKVRYRFMSICPYVLRRIERNLPEHENADRWRFARYKERPKLRTKMSRRTPLQKITESDRGRNFNDGGGALSRNMNMFTYWIKAKLLRHSRLSIA